MLHFKCATLSLLSACSAVALGIAAGTGAGEKQPPSALEVAAKATAQGVDLLVERMVQKGKAIDDQDWTTLMAIHRLVTAKAQKLGLHDFGRPDYLKMPVLVGDTVPEGGLFQEPRRVACKAVKAISIGGLIVCSGSVTADPGGIGNSVIFANGDVKITEGSLGQSTLVCAGNVDIGSGIESIVIARGNISLYGSCADCVFVSGGNTTLEIGHTRNSYIIAGGGISIFGDAEAGLLTAGQNVKVRRSHKGTVIKEKEKTAPTFLAYFEIASTGIELEPRKGSPRIASVAAGSPFARAGVRAGDTLVAANAQPLASAAELRRALRHAVVEGRCVFSARRGEDTLLISVTFAK